MDDFDSINKAFSISVARAELKLTSDEALGRAVRKMMRIYTTKQLQAAKREADAVIAAARGK